MTSGWGSWHPPKSKRREHGSARAKPRLDLGRGSDPDGDSRAPLPRAVPAEGATRAAPLAASGSDSVRDPSPGAPAGTGTAARDLGDAPNLEVGPPPPALLPLVHPFTPVIVTPLMNWRCMSRKNTTTGATATVAAAIILT